MLVCSPSYCARHGLAKTLSELSSHHCLGQRNRRDSLYLSFETGNGLCAARIKSRFEYDNGVLGREVARAGLCMLLLPTFIVARDLLDGQLVRVPLEVEPSSDVIVAVYP
jgi:DNA-binding transcriptional LysR family regulator